MRAALTIVAPSGEEPVHIIHRYVGTVAVCMLMFDTAQVRAAGHRAKQG